MPDKKQLYEWCRIPVEELEHKKVKIPFRIVEDSEEMGEMMAEELLTEIEQAGREGRMYRAILPCGPSCWYRPFTETVNERRISLKHLEVFHMDECLDWEGEELDVNDPYNFRGCMQRWFYDPVDEELAVKEENRHFLNPKDADRIRELLCSTPVDITYGGWGQDGHIAYNQARRHPFSHISLQELRDSTIRIQENNLDTIITLGQRSFGAAYQFVPPMSITLGLRECFQAKKIRLFSDTGSWKQTAFRVALFGEPDAEYPITLLQEHPDAMITATRETASHPIAEHPEWRFKEITR